ncbi:undecaprenyl-phosphate galactose phosphotransferase WbaP [Azospirillum sp. TSH100]|uniref:undecaprenyl-phosphate galactose phosphotransferase WbaP n=1 Tax=Azospirillum sp. TSH100 TaxID=652764 RepID=UPI001304F607|nr:undecaprenyl-phosphate galactose phosphotransferase WbaP [Azospirillum sp. TSH100]
MHYGVLLAMDAAAVLLAFGGAALLAIAVNIETFGLPYLDFIADNMWNRLAQYLPLAGLLLLRLHTAGHYRRRLPAWTGLRDVVVGCMLMLLADGFLMFALKRDFSRLWLVGSWLLIIVLIPLARRVARSLLDSQGLWRLPVIVVGSGDGVQDACEALTSERSLGYAVMEVLPLEQVETRIASQSWSELCEKQGARLVVLALSDTDMLGRGALLADLVRERLPFAVIPPLRGLPILGFDPIYFIGRDVMMLQARNNLGQPLSRTVKLLFDLTVASILGILLLPVFAVFAMAIASDGGPVFYRHRRIGRNGRPFGCLKFRTMDPKADSMLAAYLAAHPEAAAEWSRRFKLQDDPRVTRIGRFLRATSLDELPQLFNVLRGDMSLVGPRPVTAQELDFYGRDVVFYLETRPGMTGLWQVRGRSNTSYADRVLYDVWYVKNWSLWHDLAILANTVPVVMRRIGAF